MSQKIPQPGLQGSPWASGETGSSYRGEDDGCFIESTLEIVEKLQREKQQKKDSKEGKA